MTIRFDGRVAVVTGAGAGLGRSHARFLAERGARVVVNDLGVDLSGGGQGVAAAEAVAEEIRRAGGQAVADRHSVDTPDGAAAIVETALRHFGTVDIVVNNAGILRDKSFDKISLDDFDAVLGVHLQGGVYVTKAAWPVLKAKAYGRVVVTTSAAGLYGNFGQTNYAAAKAGLVGFMLALKEEGRKYNIHVNALAPVAFTRMLATVANPALEKKLRPEVATAAMAFLCAESTTVTGCILEAGADHFAVARLVKSRGAVLPPAEAVTPEAIAANWARISDLAGAVPHDNAMSAIAGAFQV
jgi:NAD(P)-dependent dehydrogenase (short-subunit alcohol dehydrogenase family)